MESQPQNPEFRIYPEILHPCVCKTGTGNKIFQYCTCPAGRVTYNFLSSCKPIHLSFKGVCTKEYRSTSLSQSPREWQKYFELSEVQHKQM